MEDAELFDTLYLNDPTKTFDVLTETPILTERFGGFLFSKDFHDGSSNFSSPVISTTPSMQPIADIISSRKSRIKKFGNASKDGLGVNRNYTQTSTEVVQLLHPLHEVMNLRTNPLKNNKMNDSGSTSNSTESSSGSITENSSASSGAWLSSSRKAQQWAIFLSHLPSNINQKKLQQHCMQYGDVIKLKIFDTVNNNNNNNNSDQGDKIRNEDSLSRALVVYSTKEVATEAMKQLQQAPFEGKKITACWSRNNKNRERERNIGNSTMRFATGYGRKLPQNKDQAQKEKKEKEEREKLWYT